MTKTALESTVIAAALLLTACGGDSSHPRDGSSPSTIDAGVSPALDGGSPSPIDAGGVLAVGNHRLSFFLDWSSPGLPVNGIDLTVQVPDGVQVATTADGTGRIAPTALSPGSAVASGGLLVGRYLSGTRQVRLSLTTPASVQWRGELARLTIGIPAGTTITRTGLLKTVGESFPPDRAVGLSASSGGPVDLTSAVKAKVVLQD
jgi:hypothetical protein